MWSPLIWSQLKVTNHCWKQNKPIHVATQDSLRWTMNRSPWTEKKQKLYEVSWHIYQYGINWVKLRNTDVNIKVTTKWPGLYLTWAMMIIRPHIQIPSLVTYLFSVYFTVFSFKKNPDVNTRSWRLLSKLLYRLHLPPWQEAPTEPYLQTWRLEAGVLCPGARCHSSLSCIPLHSRPQKALCPLLESTDTWHDHQV